MSGRRTHANQTRLCWFRISKFCHLPGRSHPFRPRPLVPPQTPTRPLLPTRRNILLKAIRSPTTNRFRKWKTPSTKRRNASPGKRERLAKEFQERQQRERAQDEADGAANATRWQPEDIVRRLSSGERRVVRDTLRDLDNRSQVQPPNAEIGKAIILLLTDNPTRTLVSSSVIRKWVTSELAPGLLEALPHVDRSSTFSNAVDVLKELQTPGLPEALIACLGVDQVRTRASMELNDYDSEIETLFFDTLENSDDRDELMSAVRWITFNGTRKSISAVKSLERRTEDRLLKAMCDGALRVIESKRRRR